ncbi:MAG: sensor histidine kinase, partial [Clostridia bacterium]|nr:sensor histidine kinase [Clostridia bacterium]
MKELSLNVLDITMNSVKAKATLINIHITEDDELLTMEIIDNGTGMTEEILRGVIDPFCTTRTTRKVGLGIPLLKLAAEQTGGEVTITSKHESAYPEDHGTQVTATFYK